MTALAPVSDAPPVISVRRKGHLLVIPRCPFCGMRGHTHGDGGRPGPFYGHRLTHCMTDPLPREASRGYFLADEDAPRETRAVAAGHAPGCYRECHALRRGAGSTLYVIFPRDDPYPLDVRFYVWQRRQGRWRRR
ncbi:hypothetical protein [Bradyrhizobium iriomotense]|uniref:Uncharacterized protein n=1 Tax=Bradyrhizobium iriomotense TaxID=441950 RepID=A0ABQ6AUC1_9BRAD|nr:hypothetical protein [Bradyrhizobium iriomotense]GLR85839.1 hypothetical protein GCM10007857_25500 [Bradyrhizobium iriomotense]